MRNISFLKRRQATGIGKLLALVLTLGIVTTSVSVVPLVRFEAQSLNDNSPPFTPAIDVSPDLPATTDDLVCTITAPSSDPDGDEIAYTYRWYKNGASQDELNTSTLDSSHTAENQVWRCMVIASDGVDSVAVFSDEVTILDGTPTAPLVDVTPDFPVTTDDLVCSIIDQGPDTDGDEIVYSYQWYKDDELQEELITNTVDSSYTSKDELWKCVVVYDDGAGASADTFAEVTIHNSPPSAPIVDVGPDHPDINEDLVCSISVPGSDPDGDTITYTYQWYKNGELQTHLTMNTVGSFYTTDDDIWRCVVTAHDGAVGTAATFDEGTVGDDSTNSPPSPPVVNVAPDLPITTNNLTCTITTPSSDPDEDSIAYTYQWYRDDELQEELTTNTVDSSYTAKGQIWKCVVMASDGIDSSSGGSDEVTILNSSFIVPAVDVTPNSPVTTNDITCEIAGASSDSDGDTVTYSYQWYKDNVLQGSLTTNTVNSTYTTKDQVWKCVVTVGGGTNPTAGGFDSVTILNSSPTIPVADVTPNTPNTYDNLLCTITTQSSDPDTGDGISYAYAWYKNNALQSDLTTESVTSSRTDNGDTWKCVVTASDGTDSSSGGFDQVTVNEQLSEATYYVDANNGNDDYDGRTTDTPFRTVGKAAGVVQPGDAVHIRGGVYYLGGRLTFDRSGASGNPITFEAYPGETPVIDGSNASLGGWEPPLISISANWNVFRNLEVRESPGRGIYLTGDDNVFEYVITHHNGGSGINVYGGDDNQFLYVIAHNNYDPGDSGHHADGISLSSGTANILRGCVFYENSDDGLDTWLSTGNTIENCVAYANGYDDGDGNGFKLGHTGGNYVKNSISFSNRSVGFTNNEGANNIIENCTAGDNGTNQFESYNAVNTFRNNIALGRVGMYSPTPIQDHNTWNLGIDDPGYISTDPNSPDFFALRSDSPCRGAALDDSDIGALQYGERITDLIPDWLAISF